MTIHNFLQWGKTFLLALLMFTVIGCGSISAKPAQPQSEGSSAPVKAESGWQSQTTNNTLSSEVEKGSVKEQAATNNNSGNVIAEKPEEKVNDAQPVIRDYGYRNGNKYLQQYQANSLVKQIILVEQSATEVNVAKLYLLAKDDRDGWQEILQCKAYLGKNGIDKTREGDIRTPTGDFGMLMAFGAKEDPGSLIPYTRLTNTMYLCGDKEYYNQFIDVSKVSHTCSGNSEHLLSYVPQYNYALFFDYNKENVYGKGSAIFLHCFGSYPFTMGCIAVAEENMVKILKTVDGHGRICIYSGK